MGNERRIDTHHHAVPPAYAAWLRSHSDDAGGLPIPEWSPALSLEVMDSVGVETAVLSVSTPGVHFGVDADARTWARRVNEDLAEAVRAHPGRFGFFATLTLRSVVRLTAPQRRRCSRDCRGNAEKC